MTAREWSDKTQYCQKWSNYGDSELEATILEIQ